IRISDDRTTGNAGLGARYFMSDWMLGVNTFYDNDFTGNNRRLGVGVEAWRDYLKLSANGYLRLSDWHQSPLNTMQDYDERPANGWDIRAEAYLPSYPQIGGKLMYEHYQGKNVSLDGGTSDLRDNPSAVTFGVNWTPVPLIKVGVDHTTGSGMNNTNLTLDFSYRFGVPLADQLSGSSVGFARSLAGSRYDLVDRNYDIVLQYRKQELISLSLSASGTPYLGESVIITANVNTKYGLDHVVWDAPELLAAGGTLTPLTAGTARVTLPASSIVMARSRAAVTSYTVGAVAYDTHNNESNRATLTLTPERAPQDISSLAVTADNAAANGAAQDSVMLTATDGSTGQPLAGEVVTLTFTYVSGPHQGKKLPAQEVTTDSNGQATASISSTMAGRVSVTATLKRNGNSAAT
ncbi:TPA: inverse autotransporter beta domain-containing protein, partial [Citrobacter amalonaticus]